MLHETIDLFTKALVEPRPRELRRQLSEWLSGSKTFSRSSSMVIMPKDTQIGFAHQTLTSLSSSYQARAPRLRLEFIFQGASKRHQKLAWSFQRPRFFKLQTFLDKKTTSNHNSLDHVELTVDEPDVGRWHGTSFPSVSKRLSGSKRPRLAGLWLWDALLGVDEKNQSGQSGQSVYFLQDLPNQSTNSTQHWRLLENLSLPRPARLLIRNIRKCHEYWWTNTNRFYSLRVGSIKAQKCLVFEQNEPPNKND